MTFYRNRSQRQRDVFFSFPFLCRKAEKASDIFAAVPFREPRRQRRPVEILVNKVLGAETRTLTWCTVISSYSSKPTRSCARVLVVRKDVPDIYIKQFRWISFVHHCPVLFMHARMFETQYWKKYINNLLVKHNGWIRFFFTLSLHPNATQLTKLTGSDTSGFIFLLHENYTQWINEVNQDLSHHSPILKQYGITLATS